MARAGLTPEAVIEAAATVINREGRAALTLARIADELGVKSPSLYNHVDGLPGLERSIALSGVDQLADECRTAVMGQSGPAALRSLAGAYRSFARSQPGVYALTQVARSADAAYGDKAARVLEPVTAVLAGFGITDDDLIHAARALRAALHGFVTLETENGFGLDVDVDASFEWLVAAQIRAMTS